MRITVFSVVFSLLFASPAFARTDSGVRDFFSRYEAYKADNVRARMQKNTQPLFASLRTLDAPAPDPVLPEASNWDGSGTRDLLLALSLTSPDFGKRLGQLFVLDRLFNGFSNGFLNPAGTDLGDILILNQLFR